VSFLPAEKGLLGLHSFGGTVFIVVAGLKTQGFP
jgi:hypothetical protein